MLRCISWGFVFVMGTASGSAFGADRIVKFGCDNDRVLVAIEPTRSVIQVTRGTAAGDYFFRSTGVANPAQTTVIGRGADGSSLRLLVRRDHLARVTVTTRDGRRLVDEIVFCNNP